MPSTRRLATTLAALVFTGTLLGLVPTAAAQSIEAQKAYEQNTSIRLEQRRALDEQRNALLVSLSFPGGTLEECIAALKEASEEGKANILIRGEADAIPVGPVELRDVPLANVLRLLSGEYQVGPSQYSVSMQEYPGNPGQPLAYSIEVKSRGTASPFASSATEILVLSLKEITTALPGDPPEAVVPAETILTAVETALAVAEGETAAARVQYHAESGLLVMAGNEQALATANQVVEAIARDVRTRRDRARDLQQMHGLTNPDALEEQLADARAEAEMAEVQMGRAIGRMDIAKQQMERVTEQIARNVASPRDLNTAQLGLIEAEADVSERRIRLERSVERVKQLERTLKRSRRIVAGGGTGEEAQSLRKENTMLRERLAMLEAQLATLSAKLDTGSGESGGGRGGRR